MMRHLNGLAVWSALVAGASLHSDRALATPAVDSAIIQLNVQHACSSLAMVAINEYPNRVVIADSCRGGSLVSSNTHVWRLSDDHATAAVFGNDDSFRFCADLRVTGDLGQVGLQIAPWWSPDLLGVFEVELSNGWMGGYGGRLPTFGFIEGEFQFLRYRRGTTVHLELVYLPNELTETSPATIEYRIRYDGVDYTSGPLAFTEGNPADDPPRGRWGILNDARVGGYFHLDTTGGGHPDLRAEWTNICFEPLSVGVTPTSWSRAKQLFR